VLGLGRGRQAGHKWGTARPVRGHGHTWISSSRSQYHFDTEVAMMLALGGRR
jgi:hypothetical protein